MTTTTNFTTEQLLTDLVEESGITDMIMDIKYALEHKERMNKICNQINSIKYRINSGCGGLMTGIRYDRDSDDEYNFVRYTNVNFGSGTSYGFTIQRFNNIKDSIIHTNMTIYQRGDIICETLEHYTEFVDCSSDDYDEYVNNPYYLEVENEYFHPLRMFYTS